MYRSVCPWRVVGLDPITRSGSGWRVHVEGFTMCPPVFVSRKRGHKFPLVLCHRDFLFFTFSSLCLALLLFFFKQPKSVQQFMVLNLIWSEMRRHKGSRPKKPVKRSMAYQMSQQSLRRKSNLSFLSWTTGWLSAGHEAWDIHQSQIEGLEWWLHLSHPVVPVPASCAHQPHPPIPMLLSFIKVSTTLSMLQQLPCTHKTLSLLLWNTQRRTKVVLLQIYIVFFKQKTLFS